MSSRRYFTWTIIACLGLASIVASSDLYWRFMATPSLGYPQFVRCQASPSTLPYGIADMEKLHGLRTWFRRTQRCSVSESILDCQLEIVSDGTRTQMKISSFAPSSSSDEKWVYVKWKGHIRRGSLLDLQSILCEPVSIDDPKSTRSKYPTVFYYDTDDDGRLDRKEAPIDNHAVLVWRDSDLDGFFDEEFGFNQNGGWKSDSLRIRVRVPDVAKHDGGSTTLQTDSI